jgi:CheY-like chemotaxis protein
MDGSMPDLNGIEATHLIRKDFPEVQVIALPMPTAPAFVIKKHYEQYKKAGCAGIGFMFSKNDPFTGIDLDKCILAEAS